MNRLVVKTPSSIHIQENPGQFRPMTWMYSSHRDYLDTSCLMIIMNLATKYSPSPSQPSPLRNQTMSSGSELESSSSCSSRWTMKWNLDEKNKFRQGGGNKILLDGDCPPIEVASRKARLTLSLTFGKKEGVRRRWSKQAILSFSDGKVRWTSWPDGKILYGSSIEKVKNLRENILFGFHLGRILEQLRREQTLWIPPWKNHEKRLKILPFSQVFHQNFAFLNVSEAFLNF